MRLLYLSCHAILEYDELKMFGELGIDYFSLGSYVDPQNPVDPIRPGLPKPVDRYLRETAPPKDDMPYSFLNNFDVIMIMDGAPAYDWISRNWDRMRSKRVILRTIGQSTARHEEQLRRFRNEGLQVVRYSPMEINIPGNIGCDAMIRFAKDPAEYGPWNGTDEQVITFAQNMIIRGEHCHFEVFDEATRGFRRKLYGPNNENAGELSGGMLTYEDLKQKMRDNRVYFSTGTQPASYTLNFIEALMTGIPVVAAGPRWGNSLNIAGNLYEVHKIIQNGVNGFCSDDMNELRTAVDTFMKNQEYARAIGEMGRKTAIELFGIVNVKEQWKQFLRL